MMEHNEDGFSQDEMEEMESEVERTNKLIRKIKQRREKEEEAAA